MKRFSRFLYVWFRRIVGLPSHEIAPGCWAYGDGIHDDTANLQLAFDRHKAVHLHDSTYLISDTVVTDSSIQGTGSTFQFEDSQATIPISGSHSFHFKNCRFLRRLKKKK